MCRQVMSPPRRQGMNPVIIPRNVPKEPTHGQQNQQSRDLLPEGSWLDDWMLKKRHRWSSVLNEIGQGKLMGSICCTQIPFILIAISQSHLSLLSNLYSSWPTVRSKDPPQYQHHCIVSLSWLSWPPMLMNPCSMFRLFLCHDHVLLHLPFTIMTILLTVSPTLV